MATSVVLTLIGRDRPGLINVLSERISNFGGSWLESRMARLAGEFAGILLVSVPDSNVTALDAALRDLESIGLHVMVQRGAVESAARSYRTFELDLVGHDKPGIVHEIAQALAKHDVNIEEFSSQVRSASFSGEVLFQASAKLLIPDDVDVDDLRQTLEGLAREIMVEIAVAEPSVGTRT